MVSNVTPLMMNSILPLKGVSFYQDAIAKLRVGDIVDIAHDPKNPYDGNACVVKTQDNEIVGHIPAKLAPRLLATGASEWQGTVTELIDNTVRSVRVKIAPKEVDYDLVATTITGRIIGTWIEAEGDSVAILNQNGDRVLYPKNQVRCKKISL
jgi:hypothetical protein